MRYTLCGIIFLAAATARADLTPTEIGIIGRAGSAESRRLAEHYAAARGVPQSQIYYGDIPAVDELPRAVWDSRVRPAIRAWLHNGGLEAKIRCLVTLRDIPLKIGRRDANDPAVKARQEFFAAARESRVKAITELIKGKNVDEARQVSREELVQRVGGLPQASAHASYLAMDTLAALLRGL